MKDIENFNFDLHPNDDVTNAIPETNTFINSNPSGALGGEYSTTDNAGEINNMPETSWGTDGNGLGDSGGDFFSSGGWGGADGEWNDNGEWVTTGGW